MKKTFPFIFILLLFLQGCKKNENNGTDGLTGKWKLISVYNNVLSVSVQRPADATNDFIIKFYNDKAFSGNSFKNTFSNGSYTVSNTNELRFGTYNATEVAEDAWGRGFSTVLMSCFMQSVYPCTPSIFNISNNRLNIQTPNSYDLTFERAQ